jgi:hypothetical protein
MFKLVALLVVGAAALDTAPVITLDLADPYPAYPRVVQAGAVSDLSISTTEAHYADECAVDSACTLPTPRAYDHHEGELTDAITTTVQQFIEDDKCTEVQYTANQCKPKAVARPNTIGFDSSALGMWIFHYDVTDASNNAADQVRFAMIVTDQAAPTSTFTAYTQSGEFGVADLVTYLGASATQWVDNYDTYVVQPNDFPNEVCQTSGSEVIVVKDTAAIFGSNYVDNAATNTYTWTKTDTTAPAVCSAEAFDEDKCFTTATVSSGNIECSSADNYYASANLQDVICFSDAGDDCRSLSPIRQTTNDCDGSFPKHTGTALACTVTITGTDHCETDGTCTANNVGTTTKSFAIIDTTAPVITWAAPSLTATSQDALGAVDGINVDDSQKTSFAASGMAGNLQNAKGCDGVEGDAAHANCRAAFGHAGTVPANVIQHSAGYLPDASQIEALETGYSCADDCTSVGALATSTHWHKVSEVVTCANVDDTNTYKHVDVHAVMTFDITVVGTYVLKYTCTDLEGLTASACRTVYNQDHTRPVLNLVTEAETDACASWRLVNTNAGGTCVESHPTENYIDAGSTCSDAVDSWISELVEVSGQVVDLNSPDTYVINYNCEDTAGNEAMEIKRTVYVIDATCPTCFITGSVTSTQEASFPYTDPGATCEDRFGAELAVETDGEVNVELTGTYTITYSATDAAGNDNLRALSNSAVTCSEFKRDTDVAHVTGSGYTDADKPSQVRTVVVEDNMAPIITLQSNMLMAEASSSVNGWIIAAVGSAVAGIALISFSARKTAETSVPV